MIVLPAKDVWHCSDTMIQFLLNSVYIWIGSGKRGAESVQWIIIIIQFKYSLNESLSKSIELNSISANKCSSRISIWNFREFISYSTDSINWIASYSRISFETHLLFIAWSRSFFFRVCFFPIRLSLDSRRMLCTRVCNNAYFIRFRSQFSTEFQNNDFGAHDPVLYGRLLCLAELNVLNKSK